MVKITSIISIPKDSGSASSLIYMDLMMNSSLIYMDLMMNRKTQ